MVATFRWAFDFLYRRLFKRISRYKIKYFGNREI
jgi:hypothetical protein